MIDVPKIISFCTLFVYYMFYTYTFELKENSVEKRNTF